MPLSRAQALEAALTDPDQAWRRVFFDERCETACLVAVEKEFANSRGMSVDGRRRRRVLRVHGCAYVRLCFNYWRGTRSSFPTPPPALRKSATAEDLAQIDRVVQTAIRSYCGVLREAATQINRRFTDAEAAVAYLSGGGSAEEIVELIAEPASAASRSDSQ